ncbi:MAG: ribosome assembly factor SBDS [Nanoarchaeota archaeon]
MKDGFDRERLHINVARLKKGGETFEIVIDPVVAMAYRQGKAELHDVLKSEHIFSDAKKGLRASEHLMQQLFGTTEDLAIAQAILKQGEIQLTEEFRKKQHEEKKKQVINAIHRNAIDPQTGLPHPPQRILNAMAEAKVHIDDHKSVQEQVPLIIQQLRIVLPIAIETRTIELTVPTHFANRCHSLIKGMAHITADNWLPDGSWSGTIEVAAGLQAELMDQLSAITHGAVHSKIVTKKQ